MKKIFSFSSALVFCAGIFSACSIPADHDIRITVQDNPDAYRFVARFNPNDAPGVQYFVEERLGQNGFVTGKEKDLDATLLLNDGTDMYVRSSPGLLKIRLNRHDNSEASYRAVKQLCEGVKNILAGKRN